MKKIMKRVLAMLLMVTMVFTMVACGGSETNKTNESTKATEAKKESEKATTKAEEGEKETTADAAVEADPFGRYDETVTLTCMTTISSTATDTNYAESLWTKKIKELFNIQLEYEYLTSDSAQYANRVSLMLTTGDMPDVVNVNYTQLRQMIDAELLEPLTDAWNNYASEQAVEAMTADSTFDLDTASQDGELYGIPWVAPAVETCHALFINEKWRQELNLPEPDTWENFEKLIYGFATMDPNGNGEADEFGLGLCKTLFDSGFEATSMANAFGCYPNAWVDDGTGKVIYGSVQPGMKTVLEKLAKYYKDGLIDPEFIVKDWATEAELVAENRLGAMFGIQWTGLMGSCLSSLYQNAEDPDSELWKVYPIPSVDGNETSPIIYYNCSTWMVVKKGVEHPEAVVKICNYMHFMGLGPQAEGPEGHPELGITYEEWESMWNNDGYRLYSPETEHGNIARWTHWFQAMEDGDTSWIDANYLASDQYYAMLRFKEDGYNMVDNFGEPSPSSAAWQFVYRHCGQTFMYALDQRDKGNLTKDVRGAFVSDTMVECQAALEDLEIQTFTNIITGQESIDTFDTFVDTWNALGGETITEEMNDYYKSRQ